MSPFKYSSFGAVCVKITVFPRHAISACLWNFTNVTLWRTTKNNAFTLHCDVGNPGGIRSDFRLFTIVAVTHAHFAMILMLFLQEKSTDIFISASDIIFAVNTMRKSECLQPLLCRSRWNACAFRNYPLPMGNSRDTVFAVNTMRKSECLQLRPEDNSLIGLL